LWQLEQQQQIHKYFVKNNYQIKINDTEKLALGNNYLQQTKHIHFIQTLEIAITFEITFTF
jgi:hypothetical protein